jgi:translation initiation factor 1
VITVSDLPLGEPEILALAARLKERCGTGDTVKGRCIEIQGDQRRPSCWSGSRPSRPANRPT